MISPVERAGPLLCDNQRGQAEGRGGAIHRPLMGPEVRELGMKKRWRIMNYIITILITIQRLCPLQLQGSHLFFLVIKKGSWDIARCSRNLRLHVFVCEESLTSV